MISLTAVLQTRHGCMVSPAIFALFLNDFIEMIKSSDCRGTSPHVGNLPEKNSPPLYLLMTQ